MKSSGLSFLIFLFFSDRDENLIECMDGEMCVWAEKTLHFVLSQKITNRPSNITFFKFIQSRLFVDRTVRFYVWIKEKVLKIDRRDEFTLD